MNGGFQVACPHCGQFDQIQHVPALYQGGRSSYAGGGPVVGFAGGGVAYGYGTQRGETVSDLARSLSPPAMERPGGGCLILAGLLLAVGAVGMALVAVGNTARRSFSSPAEALGYGLGTWFTPALLAAIAVALFWYHTQQNRQVTRTNSYVPAAVERWAKGWFCHRCGGVFFPAGNPWLLPSGRLLSPDEFRHIAWNGVAPR